MLGGTVIEVERCRRDGALGGSCHRGGRVALLGVNHPIAAQLHVAYNDIVAAAHQVELVGGKCGGARRGLEAVGIGDDVVRRHVAEGVVLRLGVEGDIPRRAVILCHLLHRHGRPRELVGTALGEVRVVEAEVGALALDIVFLQVVLLEHVGGQAEAAAVVVDGHEAVLAHTLIDERVADIDDLRIIPVLRPGPVAGFEV